MASGKVTTIAFFVIFIVLCSDISSVMVADAQNFGCCTKHRIGSCLTGSTADNARCHSMCSSSCFKSGNNGHCKLEGNIHYCHCNC
ncbi:hypothetical protein MKX01_004462 [Papaver californicum]|nr:hypothetical protein MKX01_004462 [Papaver californicum]